MYVYIERKISFGGYKLFWDTLYAGWEVKIRKWDARFVNFSRHNSISGGFNISPGRGNCFSSWIKWDYSKVLTIYGDAKCQPSCSQLKPQNLTKLNTKTRLKTINFSNVVWVLHGNNDTPFLLCYYCSWSLRHGLAAFIPANSQYLAF